MSPLALTTTGDVDISLVYDSDPNDVLTTTSRAGQTVAHDGAIWRCVHSDTPGTWAELRAWREDLGRRIEAARRRMG